MSSETIFDGSGTHEDARLLYNKALRKLGEWGTDHQYNIAELCVHSGELYRSLANANQGNSPASTPLFWEKLELEGLTFFVRTVDPTTSDNTAAGYPTPCLWTNSTAGTSWLKSGETAGSADWDQVAAGIQSSRQVLTPTNSGLAGGGDLSADRSFSLALSNLLQATTAASGDELVVRTAADGVHRRITKQELLGDAGVLSVFGIAQSAVDFTDFTAEAAPADLDEIVLRDVSQSINDQSRRMTRANFLTGVVRDSRQVATATGLSGGGDLTADRTLALAIQNLTALAETPAADDVFLLRDTSTSQHKTLSWSQLLAGVPSAVVTSVHGRTGDVVGAASDYDAAQVEFTPAGALAATDVQAALQELDTEKVPKNLTTLGTVILAAGDQIPIYDISSSSMGKASVQNVADFAPVQSVHGRQGAVIGANSDYDASQIDFTPAGSLAATNLQAALEELDAEKVPATRSVVAGEGLVGGGALSSDVTLYLGFQSLSFLATPVIADTVAVLDVSANLMRQITIEQLLGLAPAAPVDSVFGRTGAVVPADSDYDANQVDFTPAGGLVATDVQAAIEELDAEKVPTTRSISTPIGSGIAGGGNLAGNLSLSMDIANMTALTTPSGTDAIPIYDVSAAAHRKITRDDLFSFAGFSSETNVPTSAQILISDSGTLKVAAKSAVLPKQSWGQSTAPDNAVNDETQGYEPGSLWGYAMDASGLDHCYVCIDATDGAAKWRQITVPRFRQNANSAPTVNDDVDMRYVNSSMWHWDEKGRTWVCLDNTNGAAVWSEFGGPATRVKATLSADVTLTSGMANVVFNTESDDEFNEFNTTTGFYVAGADGQYVVEVSLHSSDSGLAAAELWTGTGLGAKTRVLQVHNNSDAHETFTLDLTAGDQVWVKAQWVGASNKTLQADSTRTFVTYRRSR